MQFKKKPGTATEKKSVYAKSLVKKIKCDSSSDCVESMEVSLDGLGVGLVKSSNPDHTSNLARLKKIQGQLNGIEKMIHSQRYCVDILIQFRAVASGLKVVEASILQKHIRTCLKQALQSKNKADMEVKLDEIMKLIIKA